MDKWECLLWRRFNVVVYVYIDELGDRCLIFQCKRQKLWQTWDNGVLSKPNQRLNSHLYYRFYRSIQVRDKENHRKISRRCPKFMIRTFQSDKMSSGLRLRWMIRFGSLKLHFVGWDGSWNMFDKQLRDWNNFFSAKLLDSSYSLNKQSLFHCVPVPVQPEECQIILLSRFR
jgi:hypothetical protein